MGEPPQRSPVLQIVESVVEGARSGREVHQPLVEPGAHPPPSFLALLDHRRRPRHLQLFRGFFAEHFDPGLFVRKALLDLHESGVGCSVCRRASDRIGRIRRSGGYVRGRDRRQLRRRRGRRYQRLPGVLRRTGHHGHEAEEHHQPGCHEMGVRTSIRHGLLHWSSRFEPDKQRELARIAGYPVILPEIIPCVAHSPLAATISETVSPSMTSSSWSTRAISRSAVS